MSYPLTLSESAKDYLSKITIDHDRPYVHLAVDSGGCSGFQYSWDFADTEEKGILVDDILVVDSLAEMFVIGCTVEYVNELGVSKKWSILMLKFNVDVVKVLEYKRKNKCIIICYHYY